MVDMCERCQSRPATNLVYETDGQDLGPIPGAECIELCDECLDEMAP